MASQGPLHTATSILFLNWNIQVRRILWISFYFPRSVLTSTSIKNSKLFLQGNSGKTEGGQDLLGCSEGREGINIHEFWKALCPEPWLPFFCINSYPDGQIFLWKKDSKIKSELPGSLYQRKKNEIS